MISKDYVIKHMPDGPGVYFFLAEALQTIPTDKKKILYIGKATSLRDRVKSYFSNDLIVTRGSFLVDMLTHAQGVVWQETDSVLEALILEAKLIKQYQPFYNTKEKDNRSFNYVVITKEAFPRVLIIRGRTLDIAKQKKELGVKYIFGPFPHGSTLRTALRIIRKMFPFIEKSTLGKNAYHFYRQLGLTPDVATKTAQKEYATHIRHIKLFFEGKKGAVVSSLTKQMKAYARMRQFEEAQEVKRRLFALEHIQDIALIKEDMVEGDSPEFTTGIRIEGYDVAHMSGKDTVGVMTVVIGCEKLSSEYKKFKLNPETGNNDIKNLEEILARRYNHPEWRFPDIAVVDGGEPQRSRAEKIIHSISPRTEVVAVVKDEHHKARTIIGSEDAVSKHAKEIILVNAEAHRFAIAYYRKLTRLSHRRLSGMSH